MDYYEQDKRSVCVACAGCQATNNIFGSNLTFVTRYATLYNMIKTWKHKGLKLFYETGSTSGIQAKHENRLKIILQRLDAACRADDMNLPGMRFHRLTGKLKDYFSVTVNGNWRVIYKFEDGHALLLDYLDYH